MGRFLFGLILGVLLTAAAFVARDNHFVRTADRWIVERKAEPAFSQTYVDTREWGLADYVKKENLKITAILAKHGIRRMGGNEKSLLDQGAKALDEGAKALGEAAEKMRNTAGK